MSERREPTRPRAGADRGFATVERVALSALIALGVGVVVFALVQRQWLLAGGAFITAVMAAIALVLLPRMYGPFELHGRRFHLKGKLVPPTGPEAYDYPAIDEEPLGSHVARRARSRDRED